MPGRLRGHRCSETPLDSSAETGGERAARVGSCRIYLLRSVHRAYLRVDLPQPEDGQRLREAMRHRGGFRLRGDDAAYGETVGPCVRVSRQSLERVMYLAEKPHQDADSAVSSVHCRSPVFRIRKPFLSKFITASRIGVLGSSYPRSCIAPPDTPEITGSTHPAVGRPGTACNTDGWICGILYVPLLQTLVCNQERTPSDLPCYLER